MIMSLLSDAKAQLCYDAQKFKSVRINSDQFNEVKIN